MIGMLRANDIMRVGNPVDDLLAFVIAETGRTADQSLDASLPLCLYFATAEDRAGFVAMVREAKPDMIMKAMP